MRRRRRRRRIKRRRRRYVEGMMELELEGEIRQLHVRRNKKKIRKARSVWR